MLILRPVMAAQLQEHERRGDRARGSPAQPEERAHLDVVTTSC